MPAIPTGALTPEDLPLLQQVLKETGERLDTLRAIREGLGGVSSIHITLCYAGTDENFIGATRYLDQDLIPFNLAMEAAALIDNSINHYVRTASGLNTLINWLSK